MDKYNINKAVALGMPFGTANQKLRKSILFHLIKVSKLDTCYRCNKKILSIEELSIEHKKDWLHSENPKDLFFDINNIAFSHLNCNVSRSKRSLGKKAPHGTRSRYTFHNCRCLLCKKSNTDYRRQRRSMGFS